MQERPIKINIPRSINKNAKTAEQGQITTAIPKQLQVQCKHKVLNKPYKL